MSRTVGRGHGGRPSSRPAPDAATACLVIPLNYFTDAVRPQRHPLGSRAPRGKPAPWRAGADALLTDELALCAGSCGPGSLRFHQTGSTRATAIARRSC